MIDVCVGKSCMIQTFCNSRYNPKRSWASFNIQQADIGISVNAITCLRLNILAVSSLTSESAFRPFPDRLATRPTRILKAFRSLPEKTVAPIGRKSNGPGLEGFKIYTALDMKLKPEQVNKHLGQLASTHKI
jgi:hypothetical protein